MLRSGPFFRDGLQPSAALSLKHTVTHYRSGHCLSSPRNTSHWLAFSHFEQVVDVQKATETEIKLFERLLPSIASQKISLLTIKLQGTEVAADETTIV